MCRVECSLLLPHAAPGRIPATYHVHMHVVWVLVGTVLNTTVKAACTNKGSENVAAPFPASHPHPAAGPRTYALALGTPLPPLYSVLTGRQPGPRVQVFTAGRGPPFATLEAGECPEPSQACCRVCCTCRGVCCGTRGAVGLAIPHLGSVRHVVSPAATAIAPDEAKGAGLLSLVSDLASATASGLLSRAKGALPGRRWVGPARVPFRS